MDITELRYFLGVARHENINRASERLKVSPGSLSKAIKRLEEELSVPLFERVGRNIRLTDHGRLLQRRASEIVQLEEAARVDLSGHRGTLNVIVAGPEILLTKMGLSFCKTVKRRHPSARFELQSMEDAQAVERVARGEAHVAIVTTDAGADSGLSSKVIGEATFRTYVGKGHPLFEKARAKRTIAIEEVLKHPFASPSHPLLGKVGIRQSQDGWRDDHFPRAVEFLTSSLKLLEEVLVRGEAISYLPDYFCAGLEVQALRISGCPYSCVQKVRLVARKPKETGWLSQVF